jgi:dihydroxy-acid dehydratase
MALPGSAAIPAVHADRLRAAEASGRQAVALAREPIRPSEVITAESIENALRVLLAIGGSTNAVVHLAAIAGRIGVQMSLVRLNELSDSTPVLVDLKPTGQHYMSDLFSAGGIGAVLRELRDLLHLDCRTVTGETLGERLATPPGYVDREIVRPLGDPYQKQGGLVALFGSLAPQGAILKRSAADRGLFEREGRAVVFASLEDLAARVDSAELDVTPDDFLVLQNAGPRSGVAMPEAGYLPIPAKLARAGVKERHRLRHDRAARDPGGRDRRALGAGAKRRSHPAFGARAADRSARGRSRTRAAPRRLASPRRAPRAWLRTPLHGSRSPG